ncbi:hypothetical protein PHLGIDRAFT_65879 [Phlebiopsis gigantea 11061_1 CR5-6]|uniref:Uncharacterized protein n=1 Tax=Phlebiopsis gigantea (strain 11061_1 CR5-6) TaxID=745531 RepID=A0A0C3S3W7_PHLG1|nr:hypothetical protein PHLGIDRAFT_65879 [Phlebiopsis gigantea 11061_1 CR5-6]
MQRPSMRRKSSAQNLLTSFKPSSATQTGTVSSATGLHFVSALPTPTGAGLMSREADVQSLQSESVPSTTLTNGSSAAPHGTSVEMLRELVKKRIITLTYLRNVHEGRSHWFHTIMMSKPELDRVFSNAAMKNRTYRFACLGMSLAHSFDVKEPQDLLRGLQNALNEYDQSKEDGERPKMRSLFRSGRAKRQPGATDYTISYTDSQETSYLIMPHVPFPLDYHQTLLSLLDILSEVYNKISKILGPSPFPSSGQHMTGPLGLLSPHPGVSYLFSGADALPTQEGDNSLWGIVNAGSNAMLYAGQLGSPPPSWNSTLGDTVKQIDTRLKKLIATLLKELDDFARTGIRDELASLDPLLRNVGTGGFDEGPGFDLEQ